MIDQDKMRALAAELRKGSDGRYKWYAMGRDEKSYFMDFDWGYDADRWFADQQKSRAAWIEQEGVHIVKKLFQTELETNAAAATDAIAALLAELEAAEADKRDAERYRLLRRGQHWSVINGIGDTLCADELDEAIDAALAQRQGEGS